MVLVLLFIEGTACYKKVSTATVPMDSDLRTLFGYILLLIPHIIPSQNTSSSVAETETCSHPPNRGATS